MALFFQRGLGVGIGQRSLAAIHLEAGKQSLYSRKIPGATAGRFVANGVTKSSPLFSNRSWLQADWAGRLALANLSLAGAKN